MSEKVRKDPMRGRAAAASEREASRDAGGGTLVRSTVQVAGTLAEDTLHVGMVSAGGEARS